MEAPLVIQQEGSGVRSLMEAALREAGARPRDLNVVAELGLQESSVTAVEEGIGVTFTSLASIEREVELGTLGLARVRDLRMQRDYVLVRSAAREPSRLATAFVEFARLELAGDELTAR
jgi:DNA-binding transcriptional LysR family regulator